MKINLFCEELSPFLKAEGKGRGFEVTSKFPGFFFFTFCLTFNSQNSES